MVGAGQWGWQDGSHRALVFLFPVDGNWSSWVNSTSCTVSCGKGTLMQTRTCTNPAPVNGGLPCVGAEKVSVACNIQSCPIPPGVTYWPEMM